MNDQLRILLIHNHYQQRGGEDSVFETECAMLRGAGHTVICYEKHNDEINAPQQGLGARGQGFGVREENQQAAPSGSPASELGPKTYGLTPSPSPNLRESAESVDNTHNTTPGTGAEPQPKLLATRYSLLAKFQLFGRTIWNSQTYREITEIIQREKPDIVHCHNTFPLISPSVYYAAARQGVSVVQTLHNYRLTCLNGYLFRDKHICELCLGRVPIPGVIHRCYRDSFLASFTVAAMLIFHRVLGTYRKKVTTYIALTEFAKQKFIAAGLPAEKIVVKPNAIAPSSFAKATEDGQGLGARGQGLGRNDSPASELGPKAYGLTPSSPKSKIKNQKSDPPIVLYVGRLSTEKGVDVLINAWRIFIANWQDTHPGLLDAEEGESIVAGDSNLQSIIKNQKSSPQLHIIGDGPERASLESLASSLFPTDQKSKIKNQKSSSILFFGSVPHVGIAAHMQAASVLVVPSIWYEQFAITPLEAMIQGTPVIVSDCARHSTILEDGKSGFVFKAGSPESLSESILQALSDMSRLRDISAKAQTTVSTSLCICDKNIQSLCDIYREKC